MHNWWINGQWYIIGEVMGTDAIEVMDTDSIELMGSDVIGKANRQ